MSEYNLVQNLNSLKLLPSTWQIIGFNDLVSDNSGGNKKLAKSKFLEIGEIAVVDQGKKLVAGYFDDPSIAVKTLPPYVVFGDHTRGFKYIDFPFVMGADGTKILQPKNENCNTKYLYYFFLTTSIPNTGYNRHFKYLKALQIPLPPLDQQKKIAAILDAADAYRQKTKALIEKYDELTQSLFMDMFGDPVTNPKGWEKIPLKEFGKVITGNTPSRKNEFNYNEKHIEWIKTNNIDNKSLFVTQAEEYLSKEGLTNGRSVKEGSLLIACIAGSLESIGRASLTNRKVAFNQQINAIEPSQGVNSRFLYYLFRMCPKYIQNHASKGMKRMLSKGAFQEIKMILPGFEIQTQFAERVQAIEEQKAQAEASLAQAEDLFNSLLQRAFKGELTN